MCAVELMADGAWSWSTTYLCLCKFVLPHFRIRFPSVAVKSSKVPTRRVAVDVLQSRPSRLLFSDETPNIQPQDWHTRYTNCIQSSSHLFCKDAQEHESSSDAPVNSPGNVGEKEGQGGGRTC